MTVQLLDQMCTEFLRVFDKCPAKIKKLIKNSSNVQGRINNPPRPLPISSQPVPQHKQPSESYIKCLYCFIGFYPKGSGPLCNFRCTLLLQLRFNSFPATCLVPIELILCIMEKIVLSPIWFDYIRDKMSIEEGVGCSCSNKIALKIS